MPQIISYTLYLRKEKPIYIHAISNENNLKKIKEKRIMIILLKH